jgi:aminopeptidase N
MLRSAALIAGCLLWRSLEPGATLSAANITRPYTVEHYEGSLRVDLPGQRITGEVSIRMRGLGDSGVSAIELDAARELTVTSVREDQAAQSFEQDRGMLFVVLSNELYPGQVRTLTLQYDAAGSDGLPFFADQMYGADVKAWMPCNDLPGERATLRLSIGAPVDARAVVSARLVSTRATEAQTITDWQLDSGAPPSRFGFAVGRFAAANTKAISLADAAMKYLADRTGKPLTSVSPTMLFVHGEVNRSFAGGLLHLPESIADHLDKRENAWLITDDLAQQWFGIAIGVKAASDLWLSEGIPAFLADGFVGRRFGVQAFKLNMESTRQVYFRFRSQGRDRALAEPALGAERNTGLKDEIAEYKGAWFLYLLDQLIGENVFWDNFRQFATDDWGQFATNQDLQNAFEGLSLAGPNAAKKKEKKTPKTVDDLFETWVYGVPGDQPKSKKRS